MPVPVRVPYRTIPSVDRVELDLNNPIFVVYVNVSGLSYQAKDELISRTRQSFDIYKNATIWIIASNETKIECVYDGQCRKRDIEISDLIKEINTRVDILSSSSSFEDFKINVRDWRINELVDGQKEK